MRVVHIITGLEDGGAEAVLYRLCMNDSGNSHVVVSLMGHGKYGPLLRNYGVPVYCLNMSPNRIRPFRLRRLWQILRAERPDVVQTWMYHADLLGGIAARLAGVRSLLWNIRHTTLEPGKSKKSTIRIARILARLSCWVPARIVCCADSAAAVHVALGYASDRMVVVHNGYDLGKFKPHAETRAAVRQELGIAPRSILLGMVGRFNPQKDHENLLDAFAQVRAQGHDVLCLLVGNGLNRTNERLMVWINDRGLTDRVILVGQRSDLPAVMNALDVHVLSSSYGEAFPNVLAEAMACGTPCVATDVGDAALIVGDTGWIVPAKDPQALAEGLIAALTCRSDREAWSQRQRAARSRIEDRYTVDAMVARYREVWDEAVRGSETR